MAAHHATLPPGDGADVASRPAGAAGRGLAPDGAAMVAEVAAAEERGSRRTSCFTCFPGWVSSRPKREGDGKRSTPGLRPTSSRSYAGRLLRGDSSALGVLGRCAGTIEFAVA